MIKTISIVGDASVGYQCRNIPQYWVFLVIWAISWLFPIKAYYFFCYYNQNKLRRSFQTCSYRLLRLELY